MVTIGIGDDIHNSNASALEVSLGFISFFITFIFILSLLVSILGISALWLSLIRRAPTNGGLELMNIYLDWVFESIKLFHAVYLLDNFILQSSQRQECLCKEIT